MAADDLDFESFDNLDDLDWSELEKNVKEGAQEAQSAPDPGESAHGGGGGDAGGGLGAALAAGSKSDHVNIGYLLDVDLQVTVEVGRKQFYISEILSWGSNSVIELEKLVGEPLNVLVNNKRVAKGEVVVVNDKFAVRIIEVLDPHDRLLFLQG